MRLFSRIMAALAATAMSAAEKLDIDKIDKNMAAKTVTYDDIQWFDPADAPFRLSGLNWFKDNKLYRRLPPIEGIPSGVEKLAVCTTAVTLAFKSDAKRIVIEAVPARSTMFMHHMASTGVSSFDIYVGGPGKWYTAGISRFAKNRAELFKSPTEGREMREFLINFPLYNGVEKLRIGVDKGAKILPPSPYASPKRIVAYGGSTMQGACASRPGLAFMNIIGRHFNMEVINFGFSGSSRFEPVMAELTAAVENPAVVIVEGDRNAGWRRIRDDEPKFIEIIRKKHPGVPIVVMNGNPWWDPDPSRKGNVAQQRAFIARMQPNDPDLIFWDCVDFIGPDHSEGLVDGKHPNDLGFYRMAQQMIERLTPIFKKYKVIE